MTLVMLLASTVMVHAQDDVEYRMEIGAGVGATAYEGDFNGSILKNMQPTGAVVYRAILNPYMAIRATGMYTQLKGDAANAGTVFPAEALKNYSFKNSVIDMSLTYEYNFLPYGTGRDYRGAKRVTPFISLGIGMTYANCKDGTWDYSSQSVHSGTKSVITACVPIGLGVKYKVAPRLNLSLDWQMHFSLSDHLDGVKDPYGIESSGMFKNTDAFHRLQLSLTYSFSPKCRTCHKL